MNDILKSKLQIIAEDDLMLKALYEAVEDRIKQDKPDVGNADNSLLGEKYRANEEARKLIAGVLSDISAYRNLKSSISKINKGI